MDKTNSLSFVYQWARPVASMATVELFLDSDLNPFNGNETLAGQVSINGTTATNIASGTVTFTAGSSNTPAGEYSVFARISALGHTRYLYATDTLTVMSTLAAPRLELVSAKPSGVDVDVIAQPGQRVVLESSSDLSTWTAVATNWITDSRWTVHDASLTGPKKFYRAAVR